MGCSAAYRLDCHVPIVTERPEPRTVVQRVRKDVERQWTLVAAVHQAAAGWPLLGTGWHWQSHFADVNMGFAEARAVGEHYSTESLGRAVAAEFGSASGGACQALVAVRRVGCLHEVFWREQWDWLNNSDSGTRATCHSACVAVFAGFGIGKDRKW